MTGTYKQLSEDFWPGLGDQHVVGASGLGVHVVDTTLAANTVKTDAQLVAAPPNTSGLSYGPVVHSLGVTPSLAIAMLLGNVSQVNHAVTFAYLTADNSAVYIRAMAWSGAIGAAVATRVIVIR